MCIYYQCDKLLYMFILYICYVTYKVDVYRGDTIIWDTGF